MQILPVLDSCPVAPLAAASAPLSPAASLPAIPAGPHQGVIAHPPISTFTNWDPACPPVLVAEDDPDDAYFIQRFIKKTGVKNRVMVFDDGSEVVNFLGSARQASAGERRRCPLLLFLDLNMQGLGGFAFLEWARQQKQLAPLTMVVLSNSNEPTDMARAMALGAHRYLVKYPSVATFGTIVSSVYPQIVF